jgi:hypothetical protein
MGDVVRLHVVEIHYDSIEESQHEVIFRVNGRQVVIHRGVLVDYDLKGSLWLSRKDAKLMRLA